jgi:hypothetical protein
MKALYSLALLAALATGNAYAACSYPTAPDNIPDGNTATLEQMIAAQKAVKEFDAAINAYTSCLKLESDAALAKVNETSDDAKKKEEQKKELERMQVQKNNAAVEADEALAARFNEQLKSFKAKNAKK